MPNPFWADPKTEYSKNINNGNHKTIETTMDPKTLTDLLYLPPTLCLPKLTTTPIPESPFK
jgi:hypothetical protein